MSLPFVGEIRMFGGNFAPAGWMFCEGQLLPIFENETLFQLIGTTYGGDGQSSFALPDLRGRLPVHQDSGFFLGQSGGQETVTLTPSQLPGHTHPLLATANPATTVRPEGNLPAEAAADTYGDESEPRVALAAASVGAAGGSQPHQNVMPFLCVSFIISLFGIFPSPT